MRFDQAKMGQSERVRWLAQGSEVPVILAPGPEVAFFVMGRYVETFWPSILGPATFLLGRSLVSQMVHRTPGEIVAFDRSGIGSEIGVSKPAAVTHAFERLCSWHWARIVETPNGLCFEIRHGVQPLSRVQVERLPARLRALHVASWGEGS